MSQAINQLPNDCHSVTFSFINPADLMPLRRVCHSWNHIILDDSRWKKFTNLINGLIKDGRISGNDFVGLRQSNFYLIKQFCISAATHFPDLFSKASEVLQDMPTAVAKIDKAITPLRNMSDWFEDNKYLPFELTHAFFVNENLATNSKAIVTIVEKMRFVRLEPNFSPLELALEQTIENEPEKIPFLLELASQVQYPVAVNTLDAAIRNKNAHSHIPELIKAIIQTNANNKTQLANFSGFRLEKLMINCPEHIYFFLEGMKAGGKGPTQISLYVALVLAKKSKEEGKTLPLLEQAIKEIIVAMKMQGTTIDNDAIKDLIKDMIKDHPTLEQLASPLLKPAHESK